MRLAALLALAAPLAACSGADRIVTGSIGPDDYRARHPIELREGRTHLEVFPEVRNGALDQRSWAQVRQFAREYRSHGSGEIALALPQGGRSGAEARAAVPGLRRALAAGGARGAVRVMTYPVVDPSLAAPVRLSYGTIVAKVDSRCGQWPNDLASGGSVHGWENRQYWNFGCATQQMMATQVADPRDLVGPGALAPPDSHMRGRAIDAVRQGRDPGTAWQTQNSNISGIGN
ncbi:CpaD family pilus assembly protein [Rhodoblastus acidophilus]|uniref:CpaD family pilus assembly protein n=1 Tax=Candidatus Rhodoblastus alkanivorans TaxID=2954117 RepID=A0ABS9ZAL9_9HYPH|nr:CpaD family pilus assembly protein [Candidatus Rhodoblastus alkanivorans]MCI4677804.1 CpaD family pilus assembly protein [Candidatus Rhodoblastus alkanivorans]MCI4684698.1 CpaD family pilus assembly protein [Candidatus Rhodoblastus alkanivorans]MDI4642020.1 CpaD family pilus assembly protein [Rhodoblastus acidophilus]